MRRRRLSRDLGISSPRRQEKEESSDGSPRPVSPPDDKNASGGSGSGAATSNSNPEAINKPSQQHQQHDATGSRLRARSPSPPPRRRSSIEIKRTRSDIPVPVLPTDGTIEDQAYFHAFLPREDINDILFEEGDFLVRNTKRVSGNKTQNSILSVYWNGDVRHVIIKQDRNKDYRFDGPSFETIPQLIAHHYNNKVPVIKKEGALLKYPVPRESWELNHDDLQLYDKLGSGAFGEVFYGKLLIRSARRKLAVAVKVCHGDESEEHQKEVLQEARIMRDYIHPNVVRMIGICTQRSPIMIVMEYLPNGALSTYLCNQQHPGEISMETKFQFCVDIVQGMHYLSTRNCMHRDLAARNCLLNKQNRVKIADFGMSQIGHYYKLSAIAKMPLRWTAPEVVIYQTYVAESDVWSFGIVLTEIYTDGQVPMCELTNAEILQGQQKNPGVRPEIPSEMPKSLHSIMTKCLEYDPKNRPSFAKLRKLLRST